MRLVMLGKVKPRQWDLPKCSDESGDRADRATQRRDPDMSKGFPRGVGFQFFDELFSLLEIKNQSPECRSKSLVSQGHHQVDKRCASRWKVTGR